MKVQAPGFQLFIDTGFEPSKERTLCVNELEHLKIWLTDQLGPKAFVKPKKGDTRLVVISFSDSRYLSSTQALHLKEYLEAHYNVSVFDCPHPKEIIVCSKRGGFSLKVILADGTSNFDCYKKKTTKLSRAERVKARERAKAAMAPAPAKKNATKKKAPPPAKKSPEKTPKKRAALPIKERVPTSQSPKPVKKSVEIVVPPTVASLPTNTTNRGVADLLGGGGGGGGNEQFGSAGRLSQLWQQAYCAELDHCLSNPDYDSN